MKSYTNSVYTHNKYHSRGAGRVRDKIFEGIVAPVCVICGCDIKRRIEKNGRPRGLKPWLNQKTCGREAGCYYLYIRGEGNSNYKGLMPKCKDCGKKVGYSTKKEQQDGIKTERCHDCWYKYSLENYWNTEEYKLFASKKTLKAISEGKIMGKRFEKGSIPWIKGKKMPKSYGEKISKIRKEQIAKGEITFTKVFPSIGKRKSSV